VSKKGLEIGVRAAMALHAANPKLRIEYRVIGDGPLRADLTRLAEELGAASTVHFLGALPGDDVKRWMHESDIYLLPSLMEQAGYVLLEAQAAGLPVVATRVGGVPEIVREGKSALLVEAGDVQGTIDALQWLVDHPNMWPGMGREGRSHVEEHHDVGRLTVQLEEVLKG
jgi:colanic acid/amylovoran biosynthesis glycosyltransferase